MAGLATDYCVYYSALDARRLGFDTVVVESGCRGDRSGGFARRGAWPAWPRPACSAIRDLD